jgi:hypothetical protein
MERTEKKLYDWILRARNSNFPVSFEVIVQKAKEIAINLNIENFNASTGWFTLFRQRHNINFLKICGESNGADLLNVDAWIAEVFLPKYKDYSETNIFNIDETALYYELLPSYTYDLSNSTPHGIKASKNRLTLCLGCNMVGSEKLEPFVIGMYMKPRCFKNKKYLYIIAPIKMLG